MSKEKHWWQQEVDCCPNCGTVSIRFRKSDELWVCNRMYCGSTFKNPLLSSKENRDDIRSLREAYRVKEAKEMGIIERWSSRG